MKTPGLVRPQRQPGRPSQHACQRQAATVHEHSGEVPAAHDIARRTVPQRGAGGVVQHLGLHLAALLHVRQCVAHAARYPRPIGHQHRCFLVRNFKLHERTDLQFRAEAFNLANTPHFWLPVTAMSSIQFGQITSTQVAQLPRVLQFALKLKF